MTETIQYQSYSTLPREENTVLSVRRLVPLRRYGRLLSWMALLGKIMSNVRFNLSCVALTTGELRRSR